MKFEENKMICNDKYIIKNTWENENDLYESLTHDIYKRHVDPYFAVSFIFFRMYYLWFIIYLFVS